jgi:hypothetical protein
MNDNIKWLLGISIVQCLLILGNWATVVTGIAAITTMHVIQSVSIVLCLLMTPEWYNRIEMYTGSMWVFIIAAIQMIIILVVNLFISCSLLSLTVGLLMQLIVSSICIVTTPWYCKRKWDRE